MNFMTVFKEIANKQRRKNGVRAYYNSGIVHFAKLYAYVRTKDGRYIPDERYAPAVRILFKMLSNKKSLPEVQEALADMRDSSGNKYGWSKIISLIRPVYAGYLDQRGRLLQITNIEPLTTLSEFRKAVRQMKAEKKRLVN